MGRVSRPFSFFGWRLIQSRRMYQTAGASGIRTFVRCPDNPRGNRPIARRCMFASCAQESLEHNTTRALTAQITSWRELEKQVRAWDGSWACVHAGRATTDLAAARRRKRAFGLLGFREIERALAIR